MLDVSSTLVARTLEEGPPPIMLLGWTAHRVLWPLLGPQSPAPWHTLLMGARG